MPQELRRRALTVIQPGFEGTAPPDWLRRLLGEGLGGVCLFARNTPGPEQTADLTAALREANPEVVVACDEEGGAITRLESAHGSSWPGNAVLGRVGDPRLTGAVAAEMGAFLAAVGITLAYAPTADVTSDPDNPVIGVRSFGSGAREVADHTAAFVGGLQSAGVAACAKHFPGHGDTSVDSHHALPVLGIDEEVLWRRELPPFVAAIQAGVRTVMAGHLLVPCLDADRPASLSPAALTGLLRGRLGFTGAIVTDALEMDAVAAGEPLPALAVRALAAGADVLCLGARRTGEATVRAVCDAVVDAVRTGVLAEERLVSAADRVRGIAVPTPPAPPSVGGGSARPWRVDLRGGRSGVRCVRLQGGGGERRGGGTSPAARPRELSSTDGNAADVRAGRRDAAEIHTPGARAPLGALAAARALELRGPAPRFDRPPVVVTFDPPRTVAVGRRTPWGVAGLLAARLPGTDTLTLTPPDCDEDGYAAALAHPARPLLLVVRDASRHTWISDAVRHLLARRPDAGVIEMGLPGPARPGAWHLATHGPSLASARAAVSLLLDR
ncbi:glycoside hydrolase family 3 N-terminal domain-containing protein [Streptomyces sp. V4-01]|uniref:Glycoside hydrolase family 3 N-terminal domain-containing protein n=1 Tax=Actinacidiphila polyblastidii TaxID=3110430 RepID=A0ABU7PAU7_9ACTN|nr:glycoside hydrolase family 3 N-terminal domain-containing protein [Streptomyces sp. V4-01]